MTLGNVNDLSISEKVAHELREAIQTGALEPGERLVERKLAERLGVSHIPVREALTKLADEGLVDRAPRRGARVAELSAEELDEISSLRTVLEQFVAARVQQRWNPRFEARLKKIVDGMITAAQRGDVDAMFALDRRFHEALWEMADHRTLSSIAAQLRGRINGFLRAANGALGGDELVAHAMSHSALIEAIAGGDAEAAAHATARHIEIAAERLTPAGGGEGAGGTSDAGGDAG